MCRIANRKSQKWSPLLNMVENLPDANPFKKKKQQQKKKKKKQQKKNNIYLNAVLDLVIKVSYITDLGRCCHIINMYIDLYKALFFNLKVLMFFFISPQKLRVLIRNAQLRYF